MRDDSHLLYGDLTRKVIGAAFEVHGKLGTGFLEKVYENALVYELTQLGLDVTQQYPISVYYEGVLVGEYIADLCIERKVIVELKATEVVAKVHEVQLLNYLKATGMQVGLVLAFGSKVAHKRMTIAPVLSSRKDS